LDRETEFNKWYNVKNEDQLEAIKDLMRAGFLPDCVFNEDYSMFRKSLADYEEYLIKPTKKINTSD